MDVGAEPGLWPLEITAREEVRALLLGRSLELAFGGDRLDRYGRLQAHAFWMEGDQRRWVQGHLLERGLARAYTLAGNRACANELLAAERIARQAKQGLWAEAAYQIRQADRPSELLRYDLSSRRGIRRSRGPGARGHLPEFPALCSKHTKRILADLRPVR
jgi:endonuclease YncB( thermonuclease family)